MALEDLISHYVSEAILPAGAIALAGGLIRGAKALETDANPRALKYVSDLLTEGDLKNIGKAGTQIVPLVFDRAFGRKPFSFHFISRSIIATTLFWLILLLVKHANWNFQIQIFANNRNQLIILIPFWYILDWASLSKARLLMTLISNKHAIATSFLFLLIDVVFSYILVFVFFIISEFIYNILFDSLAMFISDVKHFAEAYVRLGGVISYFRNSSSGYIAIFDVIIPSTLLTSVWTFLLFISCLLAQLFVPIDYLRRFTAFWFKNVEERPLTAIAKVAATLIVIGAMAIKAVHLIY